MKRKRPPPSQDAPYAVAVTPDRSLKYIGAYVRFLSVVYWKRRKVANPGDTGIVVKDRHGLCGDHQVAVETAATRARRRITYAPVALSDVRILRGLA